MPKRGGRGGKGGGRAGTTRGRGAPSYNSGPIGPSSAVGGTRYRQTRPGPPTAPPPSPRTQRGMASIPRGSQSIHNVELSPSGYVAQPQFSRLGSGRASEASIAHTHKQFVGPEPRVPSLETMAARAARRGGIPPAQMAQVLTTPQHSVIRHRVLREFPHEGRRFFGERPQAPPPAQQASRVAPRSRTPSSGQAPQRPNFRNPTSK